MCKDIVKNFLPKQKVLMLIILAVFSVNAQELEVDSYQYWRSYKKTPISEITNTKWNNEEVVIEGWDWTLPEHIEPSVYSNICIARNFNLNNTFKIRALPKVHFSANPVISHWVKWKELEKEEGNIDFTQLIENIKLAKEKGYGSIVRIHSSAINFAPDWIKKYNIPIRKENKKNPYSTNYEVSNPEFHKLYIKLIKALGESGIPKMKEVKGLFLGYASPSNGDEGIGPYHKGASANDTIQHVRERIDIWAKATTGVAHKVFMGGVSNYGLSKGFGIRRGFVEMYLYHIPDDEIGQKLDKDGYLFVDETSPIIKNNLFHGEENEEYEEKWATKKTNFRFGSSTNSFPYRYFTANLRLLQMRTNYLLNNEFALLPEMFTWVSLELGKTVDDAPDAWCFLRESYLRNKGGIPVKNFERWVYQRDTLGYETKPAIKIHQPIQMWMVQPNKYYDFVARKGNKIGFDVDDNFAKKHRKFAVKVSFFDEGSGEWSLVYVNKKGIHKKTIKNKNSGKLKTATFFIETDFKKKDLLFDIEIQGEEDFEPTISFLRIIKA